MDATKVFSALLLAIGLSACQADIKDSTVGANVCRNPPATMFADYQSTVENQVIQNFCFECHNPDGVARRLAYSENPRDNFCIAYSLGPNNPRRLLATYPFTSGHVEASGRSFTTTDLRNLIDWVNRYAK